MNKKAVPSYIHLLAISIKEDISLKESSILLEEVYNKNLYTSSNTNCNNIYPNFNKIVYNFFKNIKNKSKK